MDIMEFTASADGGIDYYGLQIWKGGEVIYGETFTGHIIKVPCSELGEGQYGAFVSCVNSLGVITTDTVSFEIGMQKVESETYNLSSFIWSADLKKCNAEFISADRKDKKTIECVVTDSIIKEPDCISSGMKSYIATASFGSRIYTDLKSETINKISHNYGEWVTIKEATCITDGEKIKKCSYCQDIKVSLTPHLGHKYLVDIVDATCYVAGSKEHRCEICGDNYIETIPPTGHTWNTGIVTTKATATTDGIRTYTCISCGETKTEIIPATGQSGNVNRGDKDTSDKDKIDTDDKNNSDKEDDSDKENPDKENDSDKENLDKDKTDISDKENTNTDEEGSDVDEDETDILEAGDMVEDVSNGDEYEIISVKGNVVCVEYLESANAKASTVTIPATIKTEEGIVCKVTAVSSGAFKNNRKIKKVLIGSNVKVIGTKAFSGCRNLTSVSIGKNVTTIGANAFFGCKKLKKLNFKTDKLTSKGVNKKAFKGIPVKTVIQVPKGKQAVYKKLFLQKGLGKKNKIR